MERIGLFVNLEKAGARQAALDVYTRVAGRGVEALLSDEHAMALGLPARGIDADKLPLLVDCLVVFGGDGTLLHAARLSAGPGTPILGVNLGQLGFLTEVEPADVGEGIDRLLAGDYHVEERMMLEGRLERDGKELAHFYGLNDIVIAKGAFSRMIELETWVGGEYVATYPADGLIISSPTGSTAYSLAAGGPLVTPEVAVMILTPICPHTFYARPLVIAVEQQVQVKLLAQQAEVMLTIDGQEGYELLAGDIVNAGRSRRVVRLVRFRQSSFFHVMREKLHLGGGEKVEK